MQSINDKELALTRTDISNSIIMGILHILGKF